MRSSPTKTSDLDLTLGQWRTHDGPAHAGRSREVSLARLSPAGVQAGVDLRHGRGFVDEVVWV